MNIPFDKKTQRINAGIQESLINSVIADRMIKKLEDIASITGGVLELEVLDTDYTSYFTAINLMGFGDEEHQFLAEKFGSVYWNLVFKDNDAKETVRLIQESWNVYIREYLKRETA